jgi:hypothetical protein
MVSSERKSTLRDLVETHGTAEQRAEYSRLIEDQRWLQCLEAAGVDNWQGIDVAHEMYDSRFGEM